MDVGYELVLSPGLSGVSAGDSTLLRQQLAALTTKCTTLEYELVCSNDTVSSLSSKVQVR